MTRVTASIVSTGEGDRLASCLRSLAAQRFDGAIAVVVVDNAGDDDVAAVAVRAYPGARVLRRDVRHGFAENHNLAQQAVPGDVALVLNPDVILEPACVAALVDGLERHPRAGMVAPLLVYPSGVVQPSARRFPGVWGSIVRRTPLRALPGLGAVASGHHLDAPDGERPVDWALGACVAARGIAWRTIGGFDPGYRPLYVEDIDIAWRMWRVGWQVWQIPAARAVHEHQAVTDKHFWNRRTVWHARGMARFLWKHPELLVGGRPVRRGAPA